MFIEQILKHAHIHQCCLYLIKRFEGITYTGCVLVFCSNSTFSWILKLLHKKKSSQISETFKLFEMHVIPVEITGRGTVNVIVDKTIVLNSLCTEGDRSCKVLDRACMEKIGLRFLTCVIVLFCIVLKECHTFVKGLYNALILS